MINLITVSRNLNINHTFIQLIKESFLLCLIVRLRITLDSERKSYFPLIDFRIIDYYPFPMFKSAFVLNKILHGSGCPNNIKKPLSHSHAPCCISVFAIN
nr:MAG TPA: hypothetical protein [Caudoviricetes sp.]